MKVKIITDTAADLTKSELEKWNVTAIPMTVSFDNESENIEDINLFWEKLIKGQVAKTSQPSPELFKEEFEKAKKENYAVVCILISSALSATYSSAVNVKNNLGYEHIHIIDSKRASGGEKMLIMQACKMRDEGKSAEEIETFLNEFRYKIKLFACLDTLKYLARSGRISKTTANVGSLLNLKPIITFNDDGEVVTFTKALGAKIATNKLVDKIKKDCPNLGYGLIPIYAHDDKNCQNLIAKIKECGYQINEHLTVSIGSTIGTHIGPCGYGIVYALK